MRQRVKELERFIESSEQEIAALEQEMTLPEVYQDYQSCMTTMTGDFPRLLPIGSYINWTGGVRSIRITPNWRSL